MASLWNDELNEALKTLVAEGYSYASIGAELSSRFNVRISRNAAIGRAGRMGLIAEFKRVPVKQEKKEKPEKNRSGEHHTIFKIRRANGNSNAMQLFETTEFVETQRLRCVEVIPRNIPLSQIEENDCRYIAGDDLLYCARPRKPGSSFCPAHHAICFRPSEPPVRPVRTWRGPDFSRRAA